MKLDRRLLVTRLTAALIATSPQQPAWSATQPSPLAIVVPGFLISPEEQFQSYGSVLRDAGCTTILFNDMSTLSSPRPVEESAAELLTRMDQLALPPNAPLFFVGHSRGAKVCVLAASKAKKAKRSVGALVLLDPVDATPKDPSSCLAELETLCVPTAMLHAGLSTKDGCAPPGSNYERFADVLEQSKTPRLIGSLPRAGHTQFVDNRKMLSVDVCTPGKDKDADVRDVAQALASEWVGAALSSGKTAAAQTEARRKAATALQAREFAARVEWLAADL